MTRRLDTTTEGASITLGVRFDAALLAIIDGEARRLEDLTGEPCDRSRALRSIVRRYGAQSSTPSTPPTPHEGGGSPSPGAGRSTSKPSAGRWPKIAARDAARLARDLTALSTEDLRACIDGSGIGRSAVYAARAGKVRAGSYGAIRSWLDARAK